MVQRQETVTIRRLFFVMITAGVSNSLWMLYMITVQDNINAFSTRNELLEKWTYMEEQQQRLSRRPHSKGRLEHDNLKPDAAFLGDRDNINMDYYHIDEFVGSSQMTDSFVQSTTPLHDLPQELMDFAMAKQMKEDLFSTKPPASGSLWDSMGMQNIGEYFSLPAFLSSDAVSIVSLNNDGGRDEEEPPVIEGQGQRQ